MTAGQCHRGLENPKHHHASFSVAYRPRRIANFIKSMALLIFQQSHGLSFPEHNNNLVVIDNEVVLQSIKTLSDFRLILSTGNNVNSLYSCLPCVPCKHWHCVYHPYLGLTSGSVLNITVSIAGVICFCNLIGSYSLFICFHGSNLFATKYRGYLLSRSQTMTS